MADVARSSSPDDSEETRKQSTKYVTYRYDQKIYAPTVDDLREVIIASPFPKTWSGEFRGVNTALAKLRNGHFLYWGTDDEPEPGQQLSRLSLEQIPRVSFPIPEEFRTWPIDDDDEETLLEDIFEAAYVMRGERLVQQEKDEDYPSGILERLRGGFFRSQYKALVPSFNRIEAHIKKAVSSFERHGGKMFGFKEKPGGIIECDIEKLSNYLRIPADVLLAFMSHFIPSYRSFQGTVSFLLCRKPEGRIKITDPVPVGRWMGGGVIDTGTGLLFAYEPGKYYSVETIDDVSWLSEYTGEGISEERELKLGKWLASAT